jgi:hypothetical protein
MIFLPLTVAATVLSGVLLVDEHAAAEIAITTANNESLKGVEILYTCFAPNVEQADGPLC